MNPKTILITGTSGFLGGTLKKFFSELGYIVYGTVRSRPPEDEYEFQLDITENNALDKLRDMNFDIIIHSLACLDHKKSRKFISEVNYKGTKKMLGYVYNKITSDIKESKDKAEAEKPQQPLF